MKRRRLRKWAKWACTIAALFFGVTWLGSARYGVVWFDGGLPLHGVGISEGRAVVAWYAGATAPRGWNNGPVDALWLSPSLVWDPRMHAAFIPLWMMLLPLAAGSAVIWRWESRSRGVISPELCSSCGYDRDGLTTASAACPECGTVPSSGPVA